MSDSNKKNKFWLVVGAIVLIVLLIVWLTFAMFTGDTDVAAFIPSIPAIFA